MDDYALFIGFPGRLIGPSQDLHITRIAENRRIST
jgi:hypothetical protein